MKDREKADYDWAKTLYELATDRSETMEGILGVAHLDPKQGDITDIDLSDLDLSHQEMSGWDLRHAKFDRTVLTGAHLKGAKIEPASLLTATDWKTAELDDWVREKALQLEADRDLPFNPALLKQVDELELSPRCANALKDDNIVYIGDLIQKTEAEMLRTPHFGRKQLNELKEVLASMGLHFGMDLPNWPPENIEDLAKRFEDQY